MSLERTAHQERVDDFMRRAGQEVPTTINHYPNEATRKLRAKLIFEEACETIRALGVEIIAHDNQTDLSMVVTHEKLGLRFNVFGPMNLREVIDGCCDIKVVTTGTLSALGVADRVPQRIVDENNLAKFGPGHTIREDGKLIKPPTHRPPHWAKEIERQEALRSTL